MSVCVCRILNYSPDLQSREIRTAIYRAFQVWTDVSQLTYREVFHQPADIEIVFASGYHSDGYPFDGPGIFVVWIWMNHFGKIDTVACISSTILPVDVLFLSVNNQSSYHVIRKCVGSRLPSRWRTRWGRALRWGRKVVIQLLQGYDTIVWHVNAFILGNDFIIIIPM